MSDEEVKQWPSSCSLDELCEDCWSIRQAEQRQKRNLEDAYARGPSPSFPPNGTASERDGANLGNKPGPKKGGITAVYTADDEFETPAAYERDGELLEVAYTQDGESELPGILNKPTARDKSRSETANLDEVIDAYTEGRKKTSDPVQRAQFEWLIEQAKTLKKLAKARKRGKSIPPNIVLTAASHARANRSIAINV